MGKLHAVTWFSMPIARLKVWRNFQVYPEFSLRNSLPASVLDVMICHPFEDVLWCVCTSSRKNVFIHWQLAMNESARNVAPPLHSVPPQIALNWKPGKMEMSNLSNQKKKKNGGKTLRSRMSIASHSNNWKLLRHQASCHGILYIREIYTFIGVQFDGKSMNANQTPSIYIDGLAD